MAVGEAGTNCLVRLTTGANAEVLKAYPAVSKLTIRLPVCFAAAESTGCQPCAAAAGIRAEGLGAAKINSKATIAKTIEPKTRGRETPKRDWNRADEDIRERTVCVPLGEFINFQSSYAYLVRRYAQVRDAVNPALRRYRDFYRDIGFDLDTGKNVTSPGVADDQPAYKAEVEDGQLVVVDFPTE